MRALVLADGDRPTRTGLDAAWPGWDRDVDLVVAADGGAVLAGDLGLVVDRWIGDGDSLGADALAALERSGIPVERASSDKDESDTELAVLRAVELGADDLTVLGALGGRRLDHALANISLLALPGLTGAARLLDDRTRVSLADARRSEVRVELSGRVGDLVTLLPWGGDAEGVTTAGLRYPLRDEPLVMGPARGLSNVRERGDAAVSIRAGRLLIVETAADA